jgi:putative redox protein
MIFHSPDDEVVGVENAATIFGAAKHPKSFISLLGADHLLTRPADAAYVADVLAAGIDRYLAPTPDQLLPHPDAGHTVAVADTGFGSFSRPSPPPVIASTPTSRARSAGSRRGPRPTTSFWRGWAPAPP